MSKAEKFIREYTNNCRNEDGFDYVPWLTPDQAKKAVEIAREEELEYVKYQLDLRLPKTLDYNGVQVDREDFINDFIKAMKDELIIMNNIVLHLMVNNECTNDCPLCCNKQYDVGKIPVVTVEELKQTETICITGGEPFLSLHLTSLIFGLIMQYKNVKNIYIYTSGEALSRDQLNTLIFMQEYYNVNMGVSIGPKSEGDRKNIQSYLIYDKVVKLNHNRFYCFNNKDRKIAELYYKNENTEIIDRKWQKDFIPAPNTIFRRLPIWI